MECISTSKIRTKSLIHLQGTDFWKDMPEAKILTKPIILHILRNVGSYFQDNNDVDIKERESLLNVDSLDWTIVNYSRTHSQEGPG